MLSTQHPATSNTILGGKPRILVISVDFDGCLFHEAYMKSDSPNRLIETNDKFIQHVLAEIEQGRYQQVVLMIGSARQSKIIDDINHMSKVKGGTESCYAAILNLCDEIQQKLTIPCTVDRMLLADIYGDRPLGENFTKSVNDEKYNYSHFVWDEYKYSIIYSQIHKIASENNNADIFYHFYDDRVSDILLYLSMFYNNNTILIPNNLILHFYQYTGDVPAKSEFKLFEDYYGYSVRGQGIVDHSFIDNIKLMARCCGFDPTQPGRLGNAHKGISQYFSGDIINEFINSRALSCDSLCHELAFEINALKKCQRYTESDWQHFLSALQVFRRQLASDFSRRMQPDANIVAIKTAKDTIKLLRVLQEDTIHFGKYANDIKREKVLYYIDEYGYSVNKIKSSLKVINNYVTGIFHEPTILSKCVHQVAEALKPFVMADDLELEKVLKPSPGL